MYDFAYNFVISGMAVGLGMSLWYWYADKRSKRSNNQKKG